MYEAESGFTTDEVTNFSGTARCDTMSNVTTEPSAMSTDATTTGTSCQPAMASASRRLMALYEMMPATRPSASAMKMGEFPLSMMPFKEPRLRLSVNSLCPADDLNGVEALLLQHAGA